MSEETKNLPRVFAAERNHKFDITPASSFGEIVYLTSAPRLLNPFEPELITDLLNDGFGRNRFEPTYDFVLMTGNPLVLSYLLSTAMNRYSRVHLLLFNARNSMYESRVFTLPE